jgi:lysophospholipase
MNGPDGNIRFDTAPDGTRLRIGHWPVAAASRRVVLCHGRTEFLEKYHEVISELNARGCDVWSMDWRGQGLSGRMLANPQKGHIDDFGSYIDDLAWFMDLMGPAQTGETILLGHSMGGHIVLRALLEGRIAPDRVVVTAPMIDLPMSGPSRAAIAGLCRVLTVTGLGGKYVFGLGDYDPARIHFDGNPLTGDRERFDAIHAIMAATPDAIMGAPTFGWLNAAFRSIRRLSGLSATSQTICPILICTALADTVVSVAAQNAMSNALPSSTQELFEDARHEILQESDAIRDRLWESFDRFIAPR